MNVTIETSTRIVLFMAATPAILGLFMGFEGMVPGIATSLGLACLVPTVIRAIQQPNPVFLSRATHQTSGIVTIAGAGTIMYRPGFQSESWNPGRTETLYLFVEKRPHEPLNQRIRILQGNTLSEDDKRRLHQGLIPYYIFEQKNGVGCSWDEPTFGDEDYV